MEEKTSGTGIYPQKNDFCTEGTKFGLINSWESNKPVQPGRLLLQYMYTFTVCPCACSWNP